MAPLLILRVYIMALSNYTDLRQKIIDQSHRDDLDLQLDDFIKLAETEMLANPEEALKMNEAEVITTLVTSTTSRLIALPADFQQARDFQITISEDIHDLKYRTPDQLKVRGGVGTPCSFTINANQIEFDVLSDVEYDVTAKYFAEFTPLNSTNTTNIVLTKYPNIYLYGCMAQVGSFTVQEQIEAFYYQKFFAAIKAANQSEKDIRFGPQLQMTSAWAP